ncbi:MAG: glycogen/starch/alpha-glucan phosphorylase, partial [Myxococcales bacterium]
YPNDMVMQGRVLRLKQEYFFVSATVQNAISRHKKNHVSLATLPEDVVFQLNDTHPGIAVAELMRLLIDEYGFGWEEAWDITTRSIAYTNHTVLPEALETWPVSMLEQILPRHLQIIYELNRRFLADVRARFPGDEERVIRMSLFGEMPEKHLRMAHLCVIGAFAVNGVSELHGRILRDRLFRDFAELWPQKFLAITNGITPRRWLQKCNPGLSELITRRIGDKWTVDLHQLRRLAPLALDEEFRTEFRQIKLQNKRRLSSVLSELFGIGFDPNSLLDVHVKRLHEYKRQLLNILHVALLYLAYRSKAPSHGVKRTFLFAGKAAPGYAAAKLIIELICAVAKAIDSDSNARDWLKVIFVPNYGVSLAELIVPAADLSEQISLAGTEASGTGNMKLALNGALTIGTADGANIEIQEAVGTRNIFRFGLTASEVAGVIQRGYRPQQIYSTSMELRSTLDFIAKGGFSPEDPSRFKRLVDELLARDRFLVLADFQSYSACHQEVLKVWLDRDEWTRRSIMNTCNMGRFSSDEVIRTYARDIWKVNV